MRKWQHGSDAVTALPLEITVRKRLGHGSASKDNLACGKFVSRFV